MPMDDSIQKSTFNFALSVGELSEEFSDTYTVIWKCIKPNVKVLYLVEKGTCTLENRVRLQEETLFVFHKVIFLKFTKSIQEFTGIDYYAPGCEPWTPTISPGVSITKLHWLDQSEHILFIYTNNFILAKLDYHTSEEPVDLFLTTPVVCTRQQ